MAKITTSEEIAKVFLKNQKLLFHTAYGYTNSAYLAEEIVGDAIVAVLQKTLSFENESVCIAYFKSTIRNKAINLLRSRYVVEPTDDADLEFILNKHVIGERSHREVELQMLLQKLLDEYPEEIREAFIAHVLDDEPIPRLAKLYGIKNDTLRKQIGRMKARISAAIPKEEMRTLLFMVLVMR